jgi:hypothetical protein
MGLTVSPELGLTILGKVQLVPVQVLAQLNWILTVDSNIAVMLYQKYVNPILHV